MLSRIPKHSACLSHQVLVHAASVLLHCSLTHLHPMFYNLLASFWTTHYYPCTLLLYASAPFSINSSNVSALPLHVSSILPASLSSPHLLTLLPTHHPSVLVIAFGTHPNFILALTPSIPTQVHYLQASSKPETCWTLLGSASRMAVSLGFHQKTRKVDTSYSAIELEEGKRAWWLCFTMEKSVSRLPGPS